VKILQAARFARTYKKLRNNQKASVDKAVADVAGNPLIGSAKKGNLSEVRVYKFNMLGQLTLMAYQIGEQSIILLDVGSHENFYRDVKRNQ
jgi:mRNA interferase RelE/StbE